MNKRKIILMLSFVFLLISVPFLFMYLTFSNSVGCDQLVIDTYELHSSINIPDVDYVNCYFDEELNTRISVYDLKEPMDLEKFNLVHASFSDHLLGSDLLQEEELPKESKLYLLSGNRWGTKWTYAIDQESNRLWAELNYQ